MNSSAQRNTFQRIGLLALAAAMTCGPRQALGQNAANGGDHAHLLPAGHLRCGGVQVLPGKREAARAAGGQTFQIDATFDASVPMADRAVIQHAINEWDTALQTRGINPGSYPITVFYGVLGGSMLALTTTTYDSDDGSLIRARMTFDLNITWYVDAAPGDDVEFQEGTPPAGFDLLTVARHEVGHAVGWIGGSSRTLNLIASGVLDASRLNVPITLDGGLHFDPVFNGDELMTPSIGASTRRPIKLYPSAALPARAFQYAVPMHFVDPAYSGASTGTAWQPWRTVLAASSQSPGLPLLLAPTIHPVARGQMLGIAHRWEAARGGARLIAP